MHQSLADEKKIHEEIHPVLDNHSVNVQCQFPCKPSG